jgi:hypothetical protein
MKKYSYQQWKRKEGDNIEQNLYVNSLTKIEREIPFPKKGEEVIIQWPVLV